MHKTTARLIDWIWSEPELADFLREIAKGEPTPPDGEIFEYGDHQLGLWIADLVDPWGRNSLAGDVLVRHGVNLARLGRLHDDLIEGRDPNTWLDEVEDHLIRDALLGQDGGGDIYVHATVKGFPPESRYQVHSPVEVYESGSGVMSDILPLPERDRQVCPVPITTTCNCTVEQKEER